MTSAELREMILDQNDTQLLEPCLHADTIPYVFDSKPATWDAFRDLLVQRLGVSRPDIRVVGSGRFGFSLTPGKNLRPYQDDSDIDVIVINTVLFDQLWLLLLEAAYPRSPITEMIGGWLGRRRNEVYTGWLSPLEIQLDAKIFGPKALPVLDFNTRWFNTFKEASRHPPRRHEDISARLYRTWQHAELYHLGNFATLRKSLLT
jgi:hypothetical protein